MAPDDLSARLRATFIGELEEQVREMNGVLLALEQAPADREHVRTLFRVAHTLKGAAAAADVPLVTRACHALESKLALVRDGSLLLAPEHFVTLFSAADALADAAERLRAGESLAGAALALWLEAFNGSKARLASVPLGPTTAARANTEVAESPHDEYAPTDAQPAVPPLPTASDAGVRIATARLDSLIASAGVLLGTRRMALSSAEELETLRAAAAGAAAAWGWSSLHLRTAVVGGGGDPDAAQALVGRQQQLRRIAALAERAVGRSESHSRAVDVITDGVLRQVRELRMRPVADACEALPRVVRDVAAGRKEARLVVSGGEVEADRAVLDGLREALVHLVRNAVDHGIESPADRVRAGKPRGGTVGVAAHLIADRIVVIVSDDGAGMDVPAIRAVLASRGRPVPDDDHAVVRALFDGGISTRDEPTPVSGRGVGMDLVRAALERVRGTVTVEWTPGRGTTVTLRLPPSISSLRAVLATVGGHTVAVPSSDVKRLARVGAERKRIEGREVLMVDDAPVSLVSLATLLPPLAASVQDDDARAIVLQVDGRSLAVVVDALVSEEEIVVQPLGRGRRRSPLLSGAAILGTGDVALVLDSGAAIAAGLMAGSREVTAPAAATRAGTVTHRILVVDDSMTTRVLEQGILEAAGYEVRTAVDGADGWRLLLEHGTDLVVSDVEMPRMDGFALCEAIRASKRFRDLPVILVTALETPEHRARGLEAGADAYIGKSSFDQRGLVKAVQELLA